MFAVALDLATPEIWSHTETLLVSDLAVSSFYAVIFIILG